MLRKTLVLLNYQPCLWFFPQDWLLHIETLAIYSTAYWMDPRCSMDDTLRLVRSFAHLLQGTNQLANCLFNRQELAYNNLLLEFGARNRLVWVLAWLSWLVHVWRHKIMVYWLVLLNMNMIDRTTQQTSIWLKLGSEENGQKNSQIPFISTSLINSGLLN